ncbi:MAG: tRNA (guanosine(37)-N1)-methyltransferase TrmD [Erysipelotrichaceae bacterium]|nr:tRNA (guanosine(37)-N1)-methyltransferase TrmD [Erysipelotrichaceae bacterium]
MRITILTLFPTMFEGFLHTSIIKRIIDKGLVEIRIVDIRDYSLDKHRHVDDTPYGGGAGMLMKVDVLHRALAANSKENSRILLTSPKAKPFKQSDARRLSKFSDIVIVCGHYEGIDYRFEKYVDEKVSIGDYVLTGGELASMVISDAIVRLLDDGISKQSLEIESFDNNLLECPQYTRPYDFYGDKVPAVLLSGNHRDIKHYNDKMALRETLKYRPDLLENHQFTKEEIALLEEIRNEFEG